MIYIICAWVFWYIFCLNLGFFVLRNISRDFVKVDPFYNFWFGLFCLILVLEFISQFFPLNGTTLLFTLLINIILLYSNLKNGIFKVKFTVNYKIIILLIVLALLISFLSNLPITWYDTYLYHLNSVKWLVDYGTVRGLANLHWPLGINSVTFLFAAIMDNGLFSKSSSHLMNSFLLYTFTTQNIFYLFRKSKNNIAFIFGLFSMLILSTFINQVTSLSTDISLAIFVLISSYYIITLDKNNIILSLPLLILAATTKFSSFLTLTLFLPLILVELKDKILIKRNLYIILLIALYLIGFALRNIMLSGWSLFPLPYFGFGLKWQVPYEQIKNINTLIVAFSRAPGPDYLNSMSNGLGWIVNWFIMYKNTLNLYLLYLLFPLVGVYVFSRDKFRKQFKNVILIRRVDLLIIACVLTVLYAFIVAPELRYMNIYIYLAISLILSAYFIDLLNNPQLKSLLIIIFIFSISGYLFYASAYFKAIELKNVSELLMVRKDESTLVEKVSIKYPDQSFIIWKPVNNDQCGNSELPCAPFAPSIKLLKSGDLKHGFYSVKE